MHENISWVDFIIQMGSIVYTYSLVLIAPLIILISHGVCPLSKDSTYMLEPCHS